MSPELRVLREPSATFRQLAASPDAGAWTLVRRPLLLMFAMGLLLSLGSSGRLSARVVVDGMISFAFLPMVEVIAVGVVYLRGDRRLPFTRVVDMYLVSNGPWLLWLLAFCAWQATSRSTTLSDSAAQAVVASLLAPAAWAAYLDLQFFRVVASRQPSLAWRDLITARAITWIGALGYFFGIAAWAQFVAWIR